MPTDPPRRRWFCFSLRTLFLIVTILGVFLGWLGVQTKWIRDRHEALKWAESYGFYETGHSLVVTHTAPGPRDAPWSIHILGEAGIAQISLVAHHADQREVERFTGLFPEAEIDFFINQ